MPDQRISGEREPVSWRHTGEMDLATTEDPRSSLELPLVSIVVPCHNEGGNISTLYERCTEVLGKLCKVEFVFVDDGSSDNTWPTIRALSAADPRVKGLSLSRNFGHQLALKSGMDSATGDAVITMDADLQHPPELLPALLQAWKDGADVVYTLRDEDRRLSWSKRLASKYYYRFLQGLSSTKIPEGAADFRLMDRSVVDVLVMCHERHLFLRGMVTWAGFNQVGICYQPSLRHSGDSSYSVQKMVGLALDGVTSFTVRPLRIATIAGVIIAGLAGIYILYILYISIFTDRAVPGWTSTTASVLFVGGIQLLMLGIVGEYVGKIFIESKKRPPYIVRQRC